MKRQKKKKTMGMWVLVLAGALLCLKFFSGDILYKSPKLLKSLKRPIDVSSQKTPPPQNIFYSFIPYWSASSFSSDLPDISEDSDTADNLIYFGLQPNSDGTIDTQDEGYSSLDTFISSSHRFPKVQTFLTLRMLNSDINFDILESPTKQTTLIREFVDIASQKNFDGVILDLEVSGFPTEKLKKRITTFSTNFAQETHKQNMLSGQLIYGDTFYRLRPYDVKSLAQAHDTLFFMMYDLHKAAGSPGPNFPAEGADMYGYSLASLLQELNSIIPSEKSVFMFGMYGYNWSVDAQERPLKPAKAQRLKDITSQFTSCSSDCIKNRDSLSGEVNIRYTSDGTDHVLWYEDSSSVIQKIDLARSLGMYQFGFWTYGYW